jgi:hypothetical protein
MLTMLPTELQFQIFAYKLGILQARLICKDSRDQLQLEYEEKYGCLERIMYRTLCSFPVSSNTEIRGLYITSVPYDPNGKPTEPTSLSHMTLTIVRRIGSERLGSLKLSNYKLGFDPWSLSCHVVVSHVHFGLWYSNMVIPCLRGWISLRTSRGITKEVTREMYIEQIMNILPGLATRYMARGLVYNVENVESMTLPEVYYDSCDMMTLEDILESTSEDVADAREFCKKMVEACK